MCFVLGQQLECANRIDAPQAVSLPKGMCGGDLRAREDVLDLSHT